MLQQARVPLPSSSTHTPPWFRETLWGLSTCNLFFVFWHELVAFSRTAAPLPGQTLAQAPRTAVFPHSESFFYGYEMGIPLRDRPIQGSGPRELLGPRFLGPGVPFFFSHAHLPENAPSCTPPWVSLNA